LLRERTPDVYVEPVTTLFGVKASCMFNSMTTLAKQEKRKPIRKKLKGYFTKKTLPLAYSLFFSLLQL
jgi:hypothetical protein